LDVRLFKERVLTAQEELEVLGVSMHNPALDVTKLMSREFLLLMQGHDSLPSRRVLQDICPCHGSILGSTGTAFPEGLHGAEHCGTTRWCQPCETAVVMILSCPHVAALTDVRKAWIGNSIQVWTKKDMTLEAS
jgi:hypothetical protein